MSPLQRLGDRQNPEDINMFPMREMVTYKSSASIVVQQLPSSTSSPTESCAAVIECNPSASYPAFSLAQIVET
jgi:hypothetical protein